jgi:hypothetical protein
MCERQHCKLVWLMLCHMCMLSKCTDSSTAADTSTDAPIALIHQLEHRVACLTSDMLDVAAAHAGKMHFLE